MLKYKKFSYRQSGILRKKEIKQNTEPNYSYPHFSVYFKNYMKKIEKKKHKDTESMPYLIQNVHTVIGTTFSKIII